MQVTEPVFDTPQIALVLASNSFERLAALLENLNNTVACKGSVIVYCVVDDDDEKMLAQIKANGLQRTEEHKNIKFEIRTYATQTYPRFFFLHKYFNEIVQESPKSILFFCGISDKVDFLPGWDAKILAYKDAFKDGLFTLSTSRYKNLFRRGLIDYFYCPDNFTFFSRTWMKLSSGFGEVWGADTSIFPIHYFLQHFDYPNLSRNLVLNNVIRQDYKHGGTKSSNFHKLAGYVVDCSVSYLNSLAYRGVYYKRALAMYMYATCYKYCAQGFKIYESQDHLEFYCKRPDGSLQHLARQEKHLRYELFAKYVLETLFYPGPHAPLPNQLKAGGAYILKLYNKLRSKSRAPSSMEKIADGHGFVIRPDSAMPAIIEKMVEEFKSNEAA